jgi:hypothetical protein
MANTDTPRGLKPVRHISGAPYNGAMNKYYVPASDGTAIYLGGIVKPAGSADAAGVPSVTGNVATGNPVIGVVVGIDPLEGAGADGRDSTTYRVASTERYVYVADDPDLIFEIQEDGEGGALAATNMWMAADITGFTSGSTSTGLSSIEIDSSTATAAGDGTEDVLIVGFVSRPENELGSQWGKFLVRLNNHFFVDGAAGA